MKIISLIKACFTSDMSLFKIKGKGKFSRLVPIIVALYLMVAFGFLFGTLFEKMEETNLQYILLPVFAFGISFVTIMEGVYKTGPLIFNCKDDQLLLSLPIKRSTVLLVRILKLYVFELLFNGLLLIPLMVSYTFYADVNWTYYLTSIVMFFTLPLIPIVISCMIGILISSFSSHFHHKNLMQIVFTMMFLVATMYFSYNSEKLVHYLMQHATSLNDLITKLYYPAGMYGKLVTDFHITDLIIYLCVNFGIFFLFIWIFSKFYFKMNSRMKKVSTSKKRTGKWNFERKTIYQSLIKKEMNTFFQTPVFIINSGFALVLFILMVASCCIKFDMVVGVLTDPNGFHVDSELINNHISLFILGLVMLASFMTSITNSVISLEGKSINILKSLPVKVKTILMSKVYFGLLLTTPVLLIGDLVLGIRFQVPIIQLLLIFVLSVVIPLVSHFIGLLVNLKYPKLDAESSTEIVKQSVSSFLSVMIGMILLITNVFVIVKVAGKIDTTLLLGIFTLIYLVIDLCLYGFLQTWGTKEFQKITI